MAELKINGEVYTIADNWDDIDIQDAINALGFGMPSKLRKLYGWLYKSEGDQPSFSKRDNNVVMPKFYRKAILLLSDIPVELVNLLSPEDRTKIYSEYVEKLIVGLHYDGNTYTYVKPEFFEHRGTKYYFPESIELFGEERPMFKEPFLTWAEVDDLFKEAHNLDCGKFSAAANIVSIMCRPKNDNGEIETYNEATSLERAKTFLDLPMSVVWEVFFCTREQLDIFSKTTAYKRVTVGYGQPLPKIEPKSAHSVGIITLKDVQKLSGALETPSTPTSTM